MSPRNGIHIDAPNGINIFRPTPNTNRRHVVEPKRAPFPSEYIHSIQTNRLSGRKFPRCLQSNHTISATELPQLDRILEVVSIRVCGRRSTHVSISFVFCKAKATQDQINCTYYPENTVMLGRSSGAWVYGTSRGDDQTANKLKHFPIYHQLCKRHCVPRRTKIIARPNASARHIHHSSNI